MLRPIHRAALALLSPPVGGRAASSPSAAEFYRTVSDHLPIMVRLRVGDDDD